tara:strand:- start:2750 stop:2914 length:165 start_codon:yes stop_codon:yes gene_type:complete
MTEVGWWYTGLFLVIIITFYAIGFFCGKGWERTTWEDKIEVEKKKEKNPKRARR